MHNTSNETLAFYDLDLLPESHRGEFESIRRLLELACDRERPRAVPAVPVGPADALVRRRPGSTSRPGRKTWPRSGPNGGTRPTPSASSAAAQRTRGLFLDRRAFLTSYDPTQDDAESTILTRILQAVFPVCAGINLEYYFSYVDNTGWGCGTKLPHNVAALLGVMDGAASDLRTGLPWQMVEIHEPVRILFIIETTRRGDAPDHGAERGHRQALPQRLGAAGRARSRDAASSSSSRRAGSGRTSPRPSVLPAAASSVDWYRGWRDHLEFAEIDDPRVTPHSWTKVRPCSRWNMS